METPEEIFFAVLIGLAFFALLCLIPSVRARFRSPKAQPRTLLLLASTGVLMLAAGGILYESDSSRIWHLLSSVGAILMAANLFAWFRVRRDLPR